MSNSVKRLIILVAIAQVLLMTALFALPQVVRALPGAYYVRLQAHPLTAGVMELITTPLPESLPAANPAGAVSQSPATLPDIPGLPTVPTALTATPTPTEIQPIWL